MRSADAIVPQPRLVFRIARQDLIKLFVYLLPPLAVYMAGARRLVPVALFLTILLWVPGVLFARRTVERSMPQFDYTADHIISALTHHLRR